jgi:hypothetical protein
MELLHSIIAGIAGTFLMTLFTDLAALVTKYNFHVPSILGTMVTMETKPSGNVSDSTVSKIWGYLLHYLIGIFYAMLYQNLIQAGIGYGGYDHAFVFGIVIGSVAVMFWYSFLKLHPMAPVVRLPLYLVFIFLGHLLFAIAMNATFKALAQIFGTINNN